MQRVEKQPDQRRSARCVSEPVSRVADLVEQRVRPEACSAGRQSRSRASGCCGTPAASQHTWARQRAASQVLRCSAATLSSAYSCGLALSAACSLSLALTSAARSLSIRAARTVTSCAGPASRSPYFVLVREGGRFVAQHVSEWFTFRHEIRC